MTPGYSRAFLTRMWNVTASVSAALKIPVTLTSDMIFFKGRRGRYVSPHQSNPAYSKLTPLYILVSKF